MSKTKGELGTILKQADPYPEVGDDLSGLEEALFVGGELVIWLTSDALGPDEEGLGRELMKELLQSLAEAGTNLKALLLTNRAVLLDVEPAGYHALERLEKQGVALLYCARSVRRLGGENRLGSRVTMFHLVQVALAAKRLLSLG